MKNLLDSGVKKNQIIYINCEDPRLSSLNTIELFETMKLYWELYPVSKKDFFVFGLRNDNVFESFIVGEDYLGFLVTRKK